MSNPRIPKKRPAHNSLPAIEARVHAEAPQPDEPTKVNDWFGRFAATASSWLGSRWAFAAAILIILIWATTGPLFHYSDTWQLVINTGTTIVTFLMVFLIQNTQNRDARAINLKLNELIRAIDKARDQMIHIENLSDIELSELQANYVQIRAASDTTPPTDSDTGASETQPPKTP